MRVFLAVLLFCNSMSAQLVCTGSYDESTSIMSGPDESVRLADAIGALPAKGGALEVEGHCRFTVPLVISLPRLTLKGCPGWFHAQSYDTCSALMFDGTGTAITAGPGAPAFTLDGLSIFVHNGSNGISSSGGTAHIKDAKIFNVDGACPGCSPVASSGIGLSLPATSSGVVVEHTQIVGFAYGVKDDGSSALEIHASQITNNGLNVGIFGGAMIDISGGNVFQDSGCTSCGITPGNIFLGPNMAVGRIEGNYFELHSGPGTPGELAIAVDPANGGNNRFVGNYIGCNGSTVNPIKANAGQLRVEDIFYSNCE